MARRLNLSMLALLALSAGFLAFGIHILRIGAPGPIAPVLGVALCVLGPAGAWAGWARPGEWRAGVLTAFVSLAVAAYLGEMILQFMPAAEERKPARPPEHDQRTKRQVVADLRKAGDGTAVPMVYPSFAIHFPDFVPPALRAAFGKDVLPLGGISAATTVLCNESGKWAVYPSDEHGFANPRGIWAKPPDIVVVGDSFSHGNCVGPEEGWVARLRSRAGNVLNLGVGGNGPLFALASLKEYGASRRPPVVLWQYFEAHDTRLPGERTLPLLRRYLDTRDFRQGLEARQPEVDALLQQIVERALVEPESRPASRSFSWRDFLRLRAVRRVLRLEKAPEVTLPSIDGVVAVLREARETVAAWNGRLVFVYLPSWYGLTAPVEPAHYVSHRRVVAAVRELGIEVIDLDPVFRAHKDMLALFPYRENLHYNADGYALVARTVADALGLPSGQAPQSSMRLAR